MLPALPSPRFALAVASAISLSVVLISACTSPGRNVLTVGSPVRLDARTVRVSVECADAVTTEIEVGAGVDGVPRVTVSGEPSFGRCRVPVELELPAGTSAIEDAATGMLLELPRSDP